MLPSSGITFPVNYAHSFALLCAVALWHTHCTMSNLWLLFAFVNVSYFVYELAQGSDTYLSRGIG